jgi:cell division protein FtsB|tara:strand:- start:1942 stop:2109 length:168 start_codon:yes stop_codon:yes gene_type:complete
MDETMLQLIAMKDAQIQALTNANEELLSKIELLNSNSDAIIELVKQLNPSLFNEN